MWQPSECSKQCEWRLPPCPSRQPSHPQDPAILQLAALKMTVVVVFVTVNDGLAIGVATSETGAATTGTRARTPKLHSILENRLGNILILIVWCCVLRPALHYAAFLQVSLPQQSGVSRHQPQVHLQFGPRTSQILTSWDSKHSFRSACRGHNHRLGTEPSYSYS